MVPDPRPVPMAFPGAIRSHMSYLSGVGRLLLSVDFNSDRTLKVRLWIFSFFVFLGQ